MSQRSLMQQATPLMVGRGLSAILTFAIPIVLARHLDPVAYGTYKQFFLIAATVYMIGQIGLTASLYYFLPRSGEDRGRYLMQALIGLLGLGVVLGLGVLATAGFVAAKFDNEALRGLALPLAIYLVCYLGSAPLEVQLTAAKKTGWAALSIFLSDAVRTAVLVGPALAGADVQTICWGAAGFAVLRLVACWAIALSGTAFAPRAPTMATSREQLRHSLPFAGAVLLATLQMHFPQYAVAALTDPATFAVFAVGIMALPTDMVYTPIAEVMMVRLASTPEAGVPVVFREAVARLLMFFIPLPAFLLAVGPELVPTLYTTTYLAAVPIFMLAVCEHPITSIPVDGLLRSLDATRAIFTVNFIRLVFTLIAVPLGLHFFGLIGAILGYLATQVLAKSLLLVFAARRLRIRVRDLLPWAEIASWTGRSVLLFGAVTVLRLEGPWHGASFLVAGTLVGAVVWILSVLTAGELRRRPTPAATVVEKEASVG
jgi:O-antigen/teichoic acid export membrane protein